MQGAQAAGCRDDAKQRAVALTCLPALGCSLLTGTAAAESVVRSVLLGTRCHGLFWHAGMLHSLLHQFLNHDFNVASVRRGLQARLLF